MDQNIKNKIILSDGLVEWAAEHNIFKEEIEELLENKYDSLILEISREDLLDKAPAFCLYPEDDKFEIVCRILKEDDEYFIKVVDIIINSEEDIEAEQIIIDTINENTTYSEAYLKIKESIDEYLKEDK